METENSMWRSLTGEAEKRRIKHGALSGQRCIGDAQNGWNTADTLSLVHQHFTSEGRGVNLPLEMLVVSALCRLIFKMVRHFAKFTC